MTQPAQWLEATDGLQSPGNESVRTHLGQTLGAGHYETLGKVALELEQKMGEITLESDGEEPKAKRESWPGAAYSSKRVSLSGGHLATRVTATKGDVLGLEGTEHCVL